VVWELADVSEISSRSADDCTEHLLVRPTFPFKDRSLSVTDRCKDQIAFIAAV